MCGLWISDIRGSQLKGSVQGYVVLAWTLNDIYWRLQEETNENIWGHWDARRWIGLVDRGLIEMSGGVDSTALDVYGCQLRRTQQYWSIEVVRA